MSKQPQSAESIACLADDGQDVSAFFTNDGKVMPGIGIGERDPSVKTVEELNKVIREKRGTDSPPSRRHNPGHR